MTVDLRSVQDRCVTLRLLFVVASYLVDHEVEVKVAHVLLEVLDAFRGPPFEHLLSIYVNQGAVSDAADAASAFEALQDLLMAKYFSHGDVLELVADLTRSLANLPALLVDRVPEVAVDLNDSFLDELAAAANIDRMRVLPNVVQSRIFCQLEFLSHCVEIDEVDSIPLLEER